MKKSTFTKSKKPKRAKVIQSGLNEAAQKIYQTTLSTWWLCMTPASSVQCECEPVCCLLQLSLVPRYPGIRDG